MAMITTTTPFLLSEVEQSLWAMGTTIPLPRRGRNVYGYDHLSFLCVEEKGVYIIMITTVTTFPLSEGEQDVWAIVTTMPLPRRGRSV